MKILFTESKFWSEHISLRDEYKKVITSGYGSVKKVLPWIADDLTFVVQTSAWECIPETGEGGYTKNSKLILLSLDPGLPFGEKVLLKQLHATIYHELNHAARYEKNIWHKDLLDSCIMEGLATVFERDYAHSEPLWGDYIKDDVKVWIEEIKDKNNTIAWGEYMYKNSDGRRWIGYKVGTYLIDEAIKMSGKSIIDLTKTECAYILRIVKL